MGQKDLYQSDFYEDKRRFADVFNGCLFEGREVMKPEELKPFVNDFKLNLFDYHEWKDFSMFKTEKRLLFEALSCGRNKRKMKKCYGRIRNIKLWIWKLPGQSWECWE